MDLAVKKGIGDLSFVATVGFFDGVHIGHRHLIDQVKRAAERRGLPSAVVTFPVHPRKVLQTGYQPALLCGFEEKIEQLATTGVDYCISLPFTVELSQLSAREFMQKVLKEQLHVDTLLVGYDHRFGHNRQDGHPEYSQYGKELGMQVILATEFQLGDDDVSSSQIRRLLKAGKIKEANELLSYNYRLSGKIVEGYQVGRTIGFPTANMRVWERYKVVPALGVYAVMVHLRDLVYPGMLYVGRRPTLHSDNEISVEVNLFDFDGNLYNQSMSVEFIDFIRADRKFDSKEELVAQIHQDKRSVKQRLKNKK
ncbi:bifunctional riboflavin kinase/FAD synthetase [Proteiniphilum sp. X52]|uniref:bifunctional riboflavin kinase/FAD synthetase n=1 Tax=Proteiniphilum sp. X52 TaxID=2382159 RepID=UPI000F0A9774|nr:bifunctional riboflavin kinase/FAD synthetase [Proteiniphilum sp. X52]RNC65805.1 bifunctional riboflavin kinase/FAD synthetase [Proteiniphilum sp. X52]